MARASMERQVNGAMKGRSIFRDEKGSTTAGMAVALLVTLSLLFSAAQVYRIHAAGSEVQEVADAAACAALNPVAEFMVAVRVADAAVLSLTLLGDIAYGAGVVACAFRRRRSWVASSFRPARRCSRHATRCPRRPARGWGRCSGAAVSRGGQRCGGGGGQW